MDTCRRAGPKLQRCFGAERVPRAGAPEEAAAWGGEHSGNSPWE